MLLKTFIGGAIGIGSTVLASRLLKVNFDSEGIYIPDDIINNLNETDGLLLENDDNVQIVISLVPKD